MFIALIAFSLLRFGRANNVGRLGTDDAAFTAAHGDGCVAKPHAPAVAVALEGLIPLKLVQFLDLYDRFGGKLLG